MLLLPSVALPQQPVSVSPISIASLTSVLESSFAIGEHFIIQLSASGGNGFLQWDLLGDIPPGMRFTAGANFNHAMILEADFTKTGAYSFSIRVTDQSGQTVTLGPFAVLVGPYINVLPGSSLRSPISGWAYAASFLLRGGSPTGDCIAAGTFPLTCTLSASENGTIITIGGTPLSPGNSNFLITVPTDAGLAKRRFPVTTVVVPATR